MHLPDHEIERICERAYYQVMNSCDRYSDEEYSVMFETAVFNAFTSLTRPQLNMRILDTQFGIVYKWDAKVKYDAREWFRENVERPRQEQRQEDERKRQEKREREEREERENEERRARQMQQQKEQAEQQARDEQYEMDARWKERYKVAESLGGMNSLEAVKYLAREAFDDWEHARDELFKYQQRRDSVNIRIYKEKVRVAEEKLDRLNERRDELEKVQHKEQNDINRKKLAEIQAQWKAIQNSADASQPVNSASLTDTIPCPQCGTMVSKTTKFCTECGTKLLVTCPDCGASLKASSKFCTNCGTSLTLKTS